MPQGEVLEFCVDWGCDSQEEDIQVSEIWANDGSSVMEVKEIFTLWSILRESNCEHVAGKMTSEEDV